MTDEEINPITTYSYSTDDELFDGEFESPEAAAEVAFYENPELESVEVGENHRVTAHRYVSADRILEDVTERAFDESGEASDHWLCGVMGSYDLKVELEKLVGDWIQAQEPPNFVRIGNVRQITRREFEVDDVVEAVKSVPERITPEPAPEDVRDYCQEALADKMNRVCSDRFGEYWSMPF